MFIHETDSDIISLFHTFDEIYKLCKNISDESSEKMIVLNDSEIEDFKEKDLTVCIIFFLIINSKPIKYNISGLWKRGVRQKVSFDIYENKDSKQMNKELFKRLDNFIKMMNFVQIPLTKIPWKSVSVKGESYVPIFMF